MKQIEKISTMAFLKQTLTLSTVGASLITSNSFWFFDFFGLQSIQNVSVPEQIGESTPSPNLAPATQTPSRSTADMNRFNSAPKHVKISGSSLKDEKLKTGTVTAGIGFDFTIEGLSENKDKYMYKITSITLGDFTLTRFIATEEEYKNFPKEEIKISLFTKAAWYSQTGEDEYSKELSRDEIKKLFENQNEAKVKQLLLSLHKGLRWKKIGSKPDQQNKFHSELFYSSSLQDLKDLKLKYFKDFDSLKNYVHTKVTTCEGEEIACIADQGELNVMETDQPSFFDELEKPKNA